MRRPCSPFLTICMCTLRVARHIMALCTALLFFCKACLVSTLMYRHPSRLLTLPTLMFLQSCSPTSPAAYSGASAAGRTRLDEVLCILEVLASMTLAPAVADAALPPSEFLTQVGGERWWGWACWFIVALRAAQHQPILLKAFLSLH